MESSHEKINEMIQLMSQGSREEIEDKRRRGIEELNQQGEAAHILDCWNLACDMAVQAQGIL